jgi:pentapeptide MXKDX repeat protein
MKKLSHNLLALCLIASGSLVLAQSAAAMEPTEKGAMTKDSMKKDTMKKDAMGKDSMTKDSMKKDTMEKDSMKRMQ